jgi:hypothetical protein
MAAATYHLTLEQGVTWDQDVVWKDSTGTPRNLSGYTARLQIRPSASSDVTYVSMTTGGGGITITAGTGTINLLLSAAATAALDFNQAVYDLEAESSSGVVTRVLQGRVTLSREVTR